MNLTQFWVFPTCLPVWCEATHMYYNSQMRTLKNKYMYNSFFKTIFYLPQIQSRVDTALVLTGMRGLDIMANCIFGNLDSRFYLYKCYCWLVITVQYILYIKYSVSEGGSPTQKSKGSNTKRVSSHDCLPLCSKNTYLSTFSQEYTE